MNSLGEIADELQEDRVAHGVVVGSGAVLAIQELVRAAEFARELRIVCDVELTAQHPTPHAPRLVTVTQAPVVPTGRRD